MKLNIQEWNTVINALELTEVVEQRNQTAAKAANDNVEAKRAYIASEKALMLREKIQRETLG